MENPQQLKDQPKSRKIWFIVAGVVLACCVIVAVGAVFAGPVVSSAIQGLKPATTEAPRAGPAAGGRGDATLKTDVWNSIVGAYATNKNCTDVTSTKVEVTQVPDSSGVWQENWTVLACGQTEVLKVKFTPGPQGGTDYKITQGGALLNRVPATGVRLPTGVRL